METRWRHTRRCPYCATVFRGSSKEAVEAAFKEHRGNHVIGTLDAEIVKKCRSNSEAWFPFNEDHD